MSSKKSKVVIPADKLALYDKLVASYPAIERKGVTMPYTSHNGHMFSMLTKEGVLGIRLSREDREAFLENYESGPFRNYGAVMREYVRVPEDLLRNTDELTPYLGMSFEYIKSLKPKPTKKPSKAKG